MRVGDARNRLNDRLELRMLGVRDMDKLAEGGQFGTKDGHIGRDLGLGT